MKSLILCTQMENKHEPLNNSTARMKKQIKWLSNTLTGISKIEKNESLFFQMIAIH